MALIGMEQAYGTLAPDTLGQRRFQPMNTIENWIAALILGSLLLVPLAYGLATLVGMREKWIYPLLRRQGPDGRTSSVVREDRSYSVAQLGESSPPVNLIRRAASSTQ
jgi:hypothetical protein